MLPVLTIPPPCGFTIGGVRAVRLWPVANVRGYSAPVGSIVPAALDLVDPANYADLYCLPDSAGYNEEGNDDAQGDFYKVKLGLFVARDAPDVSEAIARLAGGRYLVAFLDANGLTKLAGTPEWPLKLTIDTATGKKPGDRSGIDFTFAGALPARAPFYLELETAPPATRRAWSAGFNFGFS